MTKLRTPFLFFLLWVAFLCGAQAAEEPVPIEIHPLGSETNNLVEFDFSSNIATITNAFIVTYGQTVMTAQRATINQVTGDVFAEGSVRVQKDDQTWTGEHVHYNFLTGEMDSNRFRTGRYPFFAEGQGLHRDPTNQAYIATNTVITADDYEHPREKIRAKTLKIVPGKYFEARQATLYVGNVPVFFFPYYKRGLGEHQNNFSYVPGYRSTFGPYLLSSYNWFYDDKLSGSIHADWREKRGFGAGPDFNLHLGEYGDGMMRYYYTHDDNPGVNQNNQPIPNDRQRFYFSYTGSLRTNLEVNSQVAYQSDQYVIRDFFESEYLRNVEPNTFVEVNQLWQNWSLDGLVQPRVNGFFETVERLPDVRLTGFRQQILDTPLYYESESSAGYFQRLFSDTNTFSTNYAAARADTYHQITMPENFFGWLNLTPRVGGRFTYYSEASGPGATTDEQYRTVFNTGAELSTKASQVWPGVRNHFLDMDGLRHIVEPSMNYVYVPSPSVAPSQLPQFDYVLTNSLRLLPIEFPEFNAIDSIDSENVIRWGLRNRLQTKRDGKIDDLLNWAIYTDWRLKPSSGQTTFSDIFSDLSLKPRSWLTLSSFTRFDPQGANFQVAQQSIVIQPNDRWSWAGGYFYLRQGPLFGEGHNLFTSAFFYRFNENWGARVSHHFEAQTGTMQEQYYTLYRDLRSWTAALTLRVRDNNPGATDYTIAVSFSIKAMPRFRLGQDTANASTLVGY
ncbi:LPS-assembly protein LptD [Pedosphaera parvula]|uniref:Organic solvent tolerance protein n=1 Tax=Pedosphaera parvula (strain Ellin514) TaxID=320771 RepID=B9XKW6_PEDPL|nr:LPS assembly protein LptD [Pedosphaera parvula]EEF59460.1 Organic solvent tolerance protein [Pedosphaera parvula Ellin514]